MNPEPSGQPPADRRPTEAVPTQRPSLWLPPSLARATPPPGARPPGKSGPPVPRVPSGPVGGPGPAGRPGAPGPRRGAGTVWGIVLLAMVPVVVLVVLIGALLVGRDRERPRVSSLPSSGPTTDVPSRDALESWVLEPGPLRPDLPGAQFVAALDGAFDSGYVSEVAGLWLTVTGTERARDTVLHAVDPTTGRERWQRRLDNVLCAGEGAELLCASVRERDPATELGVGWRLHRLDPATGADRAVRDIDGWLTAVHRAGSAFVVLEQRQPAPHAVVSAYAVQDLTPRWIRDLSREPGHEKLFSTNRIIHRPEPKREGLALDRPRFRDVGAGLVAVWAGQQTAFLDADRGRLVMMPHCSRLVDDGRRLWCNEVDGATAYGYDGRRLVRVTGPRLAFPHEDLRGPDRSPPIFLDGEGAAVAVDPGTGTVGATYTPPGSGSAFGIKTMPAAYTVGERTFLIGGAGTLLLEPGRNAVRWRNPEIKNSDLPVPVGNRLLLGNSRLEQVDAATGRTVARYRIEGFSAIALGSRVLSERPERIALLRF